MSTSGVEFEESQADLAPAHPITQAAMSNPTTPKMIAMLLKAGIARSENAAAIMLVAISSVFFAGAVLFYLFNPFLH